MELVEVTRALKAHKILVGLVVLLAIGAGVAMKVRSHSVPTGSATSQLLIDSPQSALADLQQDTGPLAARAAVYAQLMTSSAVLQKIAHAAGVPAGELTAEGPYSGVGQVLDVPTPSEARGAQLLASKDQYHLSFVAQQDLPVITVSVTGPTAATAGRLANSVASGVQSWLSSVEDSNSLPDGKRVTIRELGDAQAGAVNSSSGTMLAGVAGVAVLMIGLLCVILIEGRRVRRPTDQPHSEVALVAAAGPAPADTDTYGFTPRSTSSGTAGFGGALHAARNVPATEPAFPTRVADFVTSEPNRPAQVR